MRRIKTIDDITKDGHLNLADLYQQVLDLLACHWPHGDDGDLPGRLRASCHRGRPDAPVSHRRKEGRGES